MLNAAGELDSLWIPPCNRLERLRGDRAGQYSIRINEQWWISEIVQGRRAISADTALRLGRFFGMEAQLWLNLQSRYDLLQAEAALAGRLEREVAAHAVVVNARGLEGER